MSAPSLFEMFRLRSRFVRVCVLWVFGLVASTALAQTEPEPEPAAPPAEPLLVVQVSSLQKILARIETNLKSVEREDVLEEFENLLADRAGDLEGFDRGRPFGVAMFLPEILPPQPVTVAYAPLTDIDSLIKTMQLGPVTVEKEAQAPGSKEARYTLKLQNGGSRFLVVRDGYAFISRDENYLEGDVATLAKLAPQLEARYDAAVTLRVKAVSPLVRDVFLGFLRTQTETQLQRRDDEPMSQYMLRRANGMSSLEFIERVVRDGEQITLGIDLPEGSESTVVELNVDAAADSEFAQYLTDLASHPSTYGAMINDRAPFTFSASWMMEPREQKVGTEWVNSLERSLNERLATLDPASDTAAPQGPDAEPPSHSSVTRVVDPLRAMIDAGHLDVCVQFRALEPGQFGLIGAMHLVGGETFAGGLRELLSTLKAQGDDLNVTLDAEKHKDIIFHRLEATDVPDRDRRLYGEGSGLYVGSSARTLWFAVGSSRAMTELKAAIDQVEEAATQPATRNAPVQLVLRANEWLELPRDENAPADRGELAGEAFTGDNDMLKVEVRPTESGARVRLELSGGYARLLALWMSRQYDRSQL